MELAQLGGLVERAGCGESRFLRVTMEGGRGAQAESSLPCLIWTLGHTDGVEPRLYLGLQGSTFTQGRPRSRPREGTG